MLANFTDKQEIASNLQNNVNCKIECLGDKAKECYLKCVECEEIMKGDPAIHYQEAANCMKQVSVTGE
jgi:hypothetical protein